MKRHTLNRFAGSLTLLAMGAFCPNLHAGWGSLQGSNHGAAPARSFSAPRPAPSRPEPVRAPEPVHTQEPYRAPEPVRSQEPYRAPEQRPQNYSAPERPATERPAAQPNFARTPEGETDRRRMDIDNERRQSYYWSDYHPGMRIDHLPDGYRHYRVHGHDYCYFDGVYYDNGPEGYVVVAPPVDADISDLPPGAETVEDASGNVYYYAGGAFYIQSSDGYVVVAPPLGVTVSVSPPDAVPVVINGVEYFQADGMFYQPVIQNGVTAYLTVPQPQ